MNYIINPYTKEKISLSDEKSLKLLKTYLKQFKYGGNYQKQKCVICLKNIDQDGGSLRETIDCNHLFHKECIQNWGENKNCPICNKSTLYGDYEK